jgi:hypothetical protein
MKLDKQNTAKTSFKLPASDSFGDICAAVSCKRTKSAGGDCVRISKQSQGQLEIFDIL